MVDNSPYVLEYPLGLVRYTGEGLLCLEKDIADHAVENQKVTNQKTQELFRVVLKGPSEAEFELLDLLWKEELVRGERPVAVSVYNKVQNQVIQLLISLLDANDLRKLVENTVDNSLKIKKVFVYQYVGLFLAVFGNLIGGYAVFALGFNQLCQDRGETVHHGLNGTLHDLGYLVVVEIIEEIEPVLVPLSDHLIKPVYPPEEGSPLS